MNENDKSSDESTTRLLLEIDTDGELDDDIHFCKRCRLMFTNLQDYLDHKVQHDKYKVSFSRNGKNRKLVIPKLIQPEDIKKETVSETHTESESGTKQPLQHVQQKKRGRKRKTEEVLKEQSVDENILYNTSYSCLKCNLKFNREAALKRHISYVHDDEKVEDSDEDKVFDEVEEEEEAEIEEEVVKPPRAPRQYNKNPDTGERPFECHVCHNRFKEATILRTHMLTHSDKRDFPCPVDGCTFAFKTKGALKRHLRRHTGERPYTCGDCGRSFTESGALTRHMRSRVPCKNKSDSDLPRYGMKLSLPNESTQIVHQNSSQVDSSIGNDESVVQISDLVAAALKSDNLHTDQDGNFTTAVVIAPDEGEITYETIGGNSDEVVVISVGEAEEETGPLLQCRVCDEQLPTTYQLKEHLRKHIADNENKCKVCHFISEDPEEMVKHYSEHHPDEADDVATLPCKEDGAKSAMTQLLELREEDEVEKLTQRCPVCLKTFRGSAYLKLHMKSHIGERPHKCSLCDKSFVTKDTLNKHMSVHNTLRQYKCGECGKLFKRISHVREHFKIHSADRPYPCTACSKSFKSANAMRVHMRTHTSLLPYDCQFCQRKFREKASLQRHVRMHTGERPYRCNRCGRAFAEHGTLNRHLKAKVSCTGHTKPLSNEQPAEFNSTVLAEFSSVVADTQQYIMSDTAEPQIEEATEYMVVETGSNELQNVEIITDNIGEVLEGVEVSGDYILMQEDGDNVRIINSSTGETIATVPATSLSESASGEIIATIPESYTEIEETVTEDQIAQSLIQTIEGNTIVDNLQITEISSIDLVEES